MSAIWPVALSALQTEEESPRHRLSPAQAWRNAIRQALNRPTQVREDVPFEQILQAISEREPCAVASLFRPIVESLLTNDAHQRALTLIEQSIPGSPCIYASAFARLINDSLAKRVTPLYLPSFSIAHRFGESAFPALRHRPTQIARIIKSKTRV